MAPAELHEQSTRGTQSRPERPRNLESWLFALLLLLVLETCIMIVVLLIWMVGRGYI